MTPSPKSIGLTAIGFKNDGPPAVSYKPFPWSWLASFLAWVLILAVVGGVVFSLPAIAEGMP